MTEPAEQQHLTPDEIDARYVDPPSTALAIIGPPGPAEWEAFKDQARWLSSSQLVKPALRGKEPDVMLIMLAGRELQIPPVMALSNVHIIEGQPTLSAKTQMALVKRAGHYMRVTESTPESATIRFGRKGEAPSDYGTFSYTLEDAKTAGLLGKTNWKNNPKAMLRARCITAVTTMEFPDVLMGTTYSAEEMGADVDPITGEVENVPAEQMVSIEDADAIYARIAELGDDQTAAFRSRMLELGLIIGKRDRTTGKVLDVRLPVRYLETVLAELELIEAWGADIPDAEVVGEGGTPGDSGGSAGEHGEAPPARTAAGTVPSVPPSADPIAEEVADAEVVEDEPTTTGASESGGGVPMSPPVAPPTPPVVAPVASPRQPDNATGGTGAPSVPAGNPTAAAPESAPAPHADGDAPAGTEPVEPSAKGQRSRFAALCAESDLNADDRHTIVSIITNGRTPTSTKTSKHEMDLAIKVAKLIRDQHVRLAWTLEDGTEVPAGEDASAAAPSLLALDPQDGTPPAETPGMLFVTELAEYDGSTVVVKEG